MTKSSHSTSLKFRAFTLIEVLLAMVIVSLVVTTIMGLLPIGLRPLQEAKQTDVQARIVKAVVSEIDMTGWSLNSNYDADLDDTFPTRTMYFDAEGNALESNNDKDQTFAARIRISSDGVPTPGGGTHILGRATNPFLQQVIVEIAPTTDASDQYFDNPKNFPKIDRHFATVVSQRPISDN